MAGGLAGTVAARILAGAMWVVSRFAYGVLRLQHHGNPRDILPFVAVAAAIVLLLVWLL